MNIESTGHRGVSPLSSSKPWVLVAVVAALDRSLSSAQRRWARSMSTSAGVVDVPSLAAQVVLSGLIANEGVVEV